MSVKQIQKYCKWKLDRQVLREKWFVNILPTWIKNFFKETSLKSVCSTNIFWETVNDNPDKDWNWECLSENPNITWEIVIDNLDNP